ncbi:MAG: hypothetical protein JWM31_3513 [Solirubrobacterales bacterium]|nr:hypothetical protein [Solirubrobacterales bacterium]
MSRLAAHEQDGAVRDERELAAWAHYADTLRELGPQAYAAAEPPAWEHLQEALAEIPAPAPAAEDEDPQA